MHARVGGCENVPWGISLLITFMIILTILFAFTLVKIFCQYTENCWENRPNVQGKENSSAQYAVKIIPRRTVPRICARAFREHFAKSPSHQSHCVAV